MNKKKIYKNSQFLEFKNDSFLDIKLYTLNTKRLFIFNSNNYIIIPNSLRVLKKNNFIGFDSATLSIKEIQSFINSFSRWIKNLNLLYKKTLVLKGLGFKLNLEPTPNAVILKFKLGLSHLIEYTISKNKLNVTLKKNILTLKGTDPCFLGNFCKKIKDLKQPNIYNGKGFWYKTEKINLKIFKKK